MKVYTLGYEKRNIDEFISILIQARVKILIDVRETAWSYKRDFCKTKFRNALCEKGIEYIHLKELGNPKTLRKSGKGSGEILNNYKSYLEDTGAGIDTLLDLILEAKESRKHICLTCFEKDHACCHRSIIIDHIQPSLEKIKIVHL